MSAIDSAIPKERQSVEDRRDRRAPPEGRPPVGLRSAADPELAIMSGRYIYLVGTWSDSYYHHPLVMRIARPTRR
ncbi:MAG: hypothetical protein KF809_05125 [Chloroflexi bacterium]|nr:hypothetical protein [Chloroflexota bacterium]